MSADIDLLPCPFCAGEADLQFKGGRTSDAYAVWCKDCNIGTAWSSYRDPVVEEWNRRATPSPAPTDQKPIGYFSRNSGSTYAEVDPKYAGDADVIALYDRSPAPIQQAQPAKYELRMRAPNGRCAPWSETDAEMHERYTNNPDIGDGFTYETRALIAAPTVKASQSDTHPSATARNEKD